MWALQSTGESQYWITGSLRGSESGLGIAWDACRVSWTFDGREPPPAANKLCGVHSQVAGELCDRCMDPTQQALTSMYAYRQHM